MPFTRPSANAEISIARTIAVPVDFTGGVRSRSSSETRLPSGIASSSASAGASAGSARCAAQATASYRRRSAAVRASDAYRASTDTPGSSTRFFRSHVTAWLNSATGPSACVHARPYRNPRNSRRHRRPVKSRHLNRSWISSACSYGVLRRSGYRFTHDASSMPSCPARYSTTSRHRQRIVAQEPADVADGADLHRHAQPVRVRTPQRDQVAVVPWTGKTPSRVSQEGGGSATC